MLVSIIVATYNGEKYLTAQLESLLLQTYNDFEIIICDDASTDNTVKIIKAFAAKHKNVSYEIQENNIGVNNNFAVGFLKARGSFIAIADQDDIWKPEKIEQLMMLFNSDNIVLAHSVSAIFKDKNLPIHKKVMTGSKQMIGNNPKKLLLRNTIAGHNIIFKKDLLAHALPFPNGVYYDWWLCQVATCYGEIAATNKVLAYQRHHDNNVTVYTRTTTKQTSKEYKERKKALEAFLTIKGLQASDKKFIQNLYNRLLTLENQTFSFSLFYFLLKNATIFFFYKTKWFPYFSYIKAAYRMSFKVE
jgi:glycosyltransferase involved in cell wall biosynthesis